MRSGNRAMAWRAVLPRARRRDRLVSFWAGLGAAGVAGLLLVDLALILQLMLPTSGELPPTSPEWPLRLLSTGGLVAEALGGRVDWSLFVLVGAGGLLALWLATLLALQGWAIQRAAIDVAVSLKRSIFGQAIRLETGYLGLHRDRVEELFHDRVEDVRRGLVQHLLVGHRHVPLLIAMAVVAAVFNPWVTLLVMLLAVFLGRRWAALRRWSFQSANEWHDRVTFHNGVLSEQLEAATSSHWARLPGTVFDDGLAGYGTALRAVAARQLFLLPLGILGLGLAAAFLLLIAGLSPEISLPGAVAVTTALGLMLLPWRRVRRHRREAATPLEAVGAIEDYLSRESRVAEAERPEALGDTVPWVRLEHVTLGGRDGQRLLDDVSLEIAPGQRLAIVASDAETSRALAGLLVRNSDPAAGQVTFDGVDISRVQLDGLRATAIWLPDHCFLFSDSVRENIRLGDERFTQLELVDAAKQARAYSFIQMLPQGFSTQIGRLGQALAPGEAFRVALARALLRQPLLLLVEEPKEQLGEDSWIIIDEALRLAAEGRTLIVLPSRVETLAQVDRVLFFHRGRLVDGGTDEELLRRCPAYRRVRLARFGTLEPCRSVRRSGPSRSNAHEA